MKWVVVGGGWCRWLLFLLLLARWVGWLFVFDELADNLVGWLLRSFIIIGYSVQ